MGLALKISDRFKNRKITFFNNFSIDLSHNSIGSTFGLSFYFDPTNLEHKEFACVTHYHVCELYYDDELLLTGNILNNVFKVSSKKELSTVSGYALTGVLGASNIPPSLYPLQSDNLTLYQIAKKLCDYFQTSDKNKIDIIVDPSVNSIVNSKFKTTTASVTDNISDYLVELASQKNIVITHNEKGNLLFTKSNTESLPIFHFDLINESYPGFEFEFEINGDEMHHEITVQRQADILGESVNAGEYTIKNPYVLHSVRRPKVITQSSGDDIDTKLVAQRALSNELKAIKLTITLQDWKLNGKVVKPNQNISIIAPELYIWKKTTFFIEKVTYNGNNEELTTVLHCVLPEVYSFKTPVSMFKGINMHALND